MGFDLAAAREGFAKDINFIAMRGLSGGDRTLMEDGDAAVHQTCKGWQAVMAR